MISGSPATSRNLRHFDFDHPTWPFRPREEDTRSKSHANPVWFKAAAS